MHSKLLLLLIPCLVFWGCANIVPPSGGKKDTTPPKLVSVTPGDSQLHVRPSRILLYFDKYITVNEAAAQVQISPLLPVPLTVTGLNKHVSIRIPDTLLEEGTTYRITFGTAIRDLHEGNIFPAYSYIFSTGSYFDSLSIKGNVIDAASGLPDSSALVVLYNAAESDSAVLRKKPLYVTHVDRAGNFTLAGLPPRRFRLYALRDANNNFIFDGGKEAIGFLEAPLRPKTDTVQSFVIRDFQETFVDTTTRAASRTAANTNNNRSGPNSAYSVLVDTSDTRRRSQDITKPLDILFTQQPHAVVSSKIFLTYDSSGIAVEAATVAALDSTGLQIAVKTDWKENMLYTLRLQKGFAKDSAGADILPGRYTFRTKREEDYATLRIHLPTKYYGRDYVLQVTNGVDTLHQLPVLDTTVNLLRIPPATYTMRIIEDRNHNGRWDTGDLLAKKQPEIVIPFPEPMTLKPGWELDEDFNAPNVSKTAAPAGTPADTTRQGQLFQGR